MLIGELMKETGLSRDTIRFYEAMRLLVSCARPAGSRTYKEYPPEMVTRLKNIKQAQNAGFTLREIKAISEEWGGDVSQIPEQEITALLTAKLAHVEQRLQDLHATRAYLQAKLQRLQSG